jgi:hypothetical protein
MRDNFERASSSYVLLSVDQDQFDKFLDYLLSNDIGHKQLKGAYRMRESNEFVFEDSVIINQKNLDILVDAGWLNNQESVLVLTDKDWNNTYAAKLLMLNDKSTMDLGRLMQVSEQTAMSNADGYTYHPEQNKFYVCK